MFAADRDQRLEDSLDAQTQAQLPLSASGSLEATRMPDVRWSRFVLSVGVMLALLLLGLMGAALIVILEWWWIAFGASHMAITAIGGYITASLWPKRPWLRHAVFWVVLLGWTGVLVPVAFFNPPGGTADGGDQIARIILPIIASGALLPYAADQWLGICNPRHLLRSPRNVCPSCGYLVGVSAVCTECGALLPRTGRTSLKSAEGPELARRHRLQRSSSSADRTERGSRQWRRRSCPATSASRPM